MPSGPSTRPVKIDEAPVPMKNTAIIPVADHLSPSQPAGNAQAPNRIAPGME